MTATYHSVLLFIFSSVFFCFLDFTPIANYLLLIYTYYLSSYFIYVFL